MASKTTKRNQLTAWLAERRPAVVDRSVQEELARALAPISARYLRELLRAAEVPLDPLVEGVRQDSLENLERTLGALTDAYLSARQAGDRETGRACRTLVIEAKDHARWSLKKSADAQIARAKSEMIEWMLVWLENPEVFPVWARLRRGVRETAEKGKRQDAP